MRRPILGRHGARPSGHSARLAGQRARRLAALRLPRVQPDRDPPDGGGPRRPPDDAPLVLPDSAGRRATRPRARDRAAQPRRAAGAEDRLRAAASSSRRASPSCCAASRASRWSTRRDAPSRTSRASTPARPRRCGRAASTSSRRAISSRPSRPRGRPRSSSRTARPPRRSTGSRTGPSRPRRPRCAPARPLTEYQLQQQMVAWFDEEGLVSRLGAGRGGGPHAGNPHYLPTAGQRVASSGPTSCCCSTSGASWHSRARCLLISRGSASPARAVPPTHGRGVRRGRPGARRRGAAGADRGAATGASCAAGKWIGRRGPVLVDAGFEAQVLHRTGHSLGESVHGNGVHLDDYETHDDRRLLPGTGLHRRAGRVLRRLRRANGNQRVSWRARGAS